MRKQNENNKTAKLIIAILLINTIFIFGFSNSSSAAPTLSISANPTSIFLDDEITISWGASPIPSTGGVSFSNYKSYIYKSTNNGVSWNRIAIKSGLGGTYIFNPEAPGDYMFKARVYATYIYYPGGSSSTSALAGEGISNVVEVNGLSSDYNLNGAQLFGSYNRKFPVYDNSEIEFIIGTLDSLSNIMPEISFKIHQTSSDFLFGFSTEANIKMDGIIIHTTGYTFTHDPEGNNFEYTTTIPELGEEGTHIISIELIDKKEGDNGVSDGIDDNDKFILDCLKISNLNFVDCNGTFTFNHDVTGGNPLGWISRNTDIVNSNQVILENYDNTDGKLLKILNNNYDENPNLKRTFKVQDIYKEKILYLDYDISFKSSYFTYFKKFSINFNDNEQNMDKLRVFLDPLGNFGIEDGDEVYGHSKEYISTLDPDRMYNIELIFSFLQNIDSSQPNICCQAYIDNVFQGIFSITVLNWNKITDIEIRNEDILDVYMDNLYYGFMDFDEMPEENVNWPIPITWIEPSEIEGIKTQLIFYSRKTSSGRIDANFNIPIFPTNEYIGMGVPISVTLKEWEYDEDDPENKIPFLTIFSAEYDDTVDIKDKTQIVYYKITGNGIKTKIKYPGTDLVVRTVLSNFRNGNAELKIAFVSSFENIYRDIGSFPDHYGPDNLDWEEKPKKENGEPFICKFSDYYEGICTTNIPIDMVTGKKELEQEFRNILFRSWEHTIFGISLFGLLDFSITHTYTEETVYINQIIGDFSPNYQEYRFRVLQPENYSHPWGIHQIRVVPEDYDPSA